MKVEPFVRPSRVADGLDAAPCGCHIARALRVVSIANRGGAWVARKPQVDQGAMHLGTLLYTWLYGEKIGADKFGNRYYRSWRAPRYGRERRWVVYKGKTEASKVPPEWHAWLHHMVAEPLADKVEKARPWQKEHVPNLTGTPYAYRPKGHILRGGQRARATGDYEPWVPE